MIETGTLLQNRYLIERQIGEGGMGAVYLAVDQRFGSKVAIKETFYKNDELGAAFEREAHLLNSLHHPVLPHVSDFFAEKNEYFLVMQFIDGEDLFETLKREGAFPVSEVLRWTDNLLDALDYLHSQEPPIIHRDIKPQNLKITSRGDIILLDFGLAKLKSEDTTGMKSIFGYSRKYSPLEQIQGTGTDARSDIFALAATAYHLLTGVPPIEVIARASAIIHGEPDPLKPASEINKDIPIGVASVLNSALALNAAQRFASAKAMRQALEHAADAIPVESIEPVPQSVLVGVPESFEVVNADEIENFTALESFAASAANELSETINSKQEDSSKEAEPIRIPISAAEVTVPESHITPQDSYVGGMTTKVAVRAKPIDIRYAALAAVLICLVLGALYFIDGTNSSNASNQAPTTELTAESNSNINQLPAVSDAPPIEITETSLLENKEELPKSKSVSTAKNVSKKEVDDKPDAQIETTEKPKPAESGIKISDQAPVPIPRRQPTQPQNQPRPRAVETESAPDIESIFTGRPSGKQNRMQRPREERRQQRDDWSEEELREMRRERRQTRKPRNNGNEIPF